MSYADVILKWSAMGLKTPDVTEVSKTKLPPVLFHTVRKPTRFYRSGFLFSTSSTYFVYGF